MTRTQYGIRLSDVRMKFIICVPADSLTHAEDVVNWHNDPKHESCYEATVVMRTITTTEWESVGPARNVVA